ncbi:transposase [Streptomyces sp. AK02-01A]|uniref:transposase n=1 Tax=Streptomyces sp. AK02-01A TaxID=3028648 RepID=UPI0039F6961D
MFRGPYAGRQLGQALGLTADVHDSKAAPALLETFMQQPGRLLQLVWVDSAYQGPALAKAFARHGLRTEVVRAPTDNADLSYWPAGGSWSGR